MDHKLLEKFDLNEQVAIITGGAGLLGSQFCQTLARAGARVVCADANLHSAETLADRLTAQGLVVWPFQVDVTSPDRNKEMVAFALSHFSRVDILITCAAVDPKFDSISQAQFDYRFEEYPLSLWQKTLDVNLTGAFLSAQAAIPAMMKTGYGVVVMISSIYGMVAPDQRVYPSSAAAPRYKPADYPVTKSAILGLVKYLAAYYAGQPIRVNALTPGGVYNGQSEDFIRNYSARSMLGRMAEAEELNGALLFLASPASSYMNGANLVVDGGWTAW